MADRQTEEKAKQSVITYAKTWGGTSSLPPSPPLHPLIVSFRITRPTHHPGSPHNSPSAPSTAVSSDALPARPPLQCVPEYLRLQSRCRRHKRCVVWSLHAISETEKAIAWEQIRDKGIDTGDDDGVVCG